MVSKESGSGVKWNHNSILGFTDDETVMLDFDESPFKTVKYWAQITMKHFLLGGFLILKSSENHYHVIFNNKVNWAENMSIVAWVSLQSNNQNMLRYLRMQCIKKSSTLRVGPKGEKSSPRIVYRVGNQDVQIKEFLELRREIKKYCHRSKYDTVITSQCTKCYYFLKLI
jgi:hypothetical protein